MIYTRFGTRVTVLANGPVEPWEDSDAPPVWLLCRCHRDQGDIDKTVRLIDLRADGGIQEILKAIPK